MFHLWINTNFKFWFQLVVQDRIVQHGKVDNKEMLRREGNSVNTTSYKSSIVCLFASIFYCGVDIILCGDGCYLQHTTDIIVFFFI